MIETLPIQGHNYVSSALFSSLPESLHVSTMRPFFTFIQTGVTLVGLTSSSSLSSLSPSALSNIGLDIACPVASLPDLAFPDLAFNLGIGLLPSAMPWSNIGLDTACPMASLPDLAVPDSAFNLDFLLSRKKATAVATCRAA